MSLSKKDAVGIHITDTSIEVVWLEKHGSAAQVKSRTEHILSPGLVEHGRPVDAKALASFLQEILRGAKPIPIKDSDVFVALPAQQVYVHPLRVTGVHKKLDEYLTQAIYRALPLAPEDIMFDYLVTQQADDWQDVVIVAASHQVVCEWLAVFQEAQLSVQHFDVPSLALFRDLFTQPPEKTVALVDIGQEVTNISIFSAAGLQFTRTIYMGAGVLTERLKRVESLTDEEAEKKKKRHGVAQKKKKSALAIQEGVQEIFHEVKRTFDVYQKKVQEPVSSAVLVGKGSRLSGLLGIAKEQLNVPVAQGKSVLLQKPVGSEYACALGVAWRGLSSRWDKRDPKLVCTQENKTALFHDADRTVAGETAGEKSPRSRNWLWLMVIALCAFVAVLALLVWQLFF